MSKDTLIQKLAMALAAAHFKEAEAQEQWDDMGVADFEDAGLYAAQNWKGFIYQAEAAIAAMGVPEAQDRNLVGLNSPALSNSTLIDKTLNNNGVRKAMETYAEESGEDVSYFDMKYAIQAYENHRSSEMRETELTAAYEKALADQQAQHEEEIEHLKKSEIPVIDDNSPMDEECRLKFHAWSKTQGGNIDHTNYEAWKAGYRNAPKREAQPQEISVLNENSLETALKAYCLISDHGMANKEALSTAIGVYLNATRDKVPPQSVYDIMWDFLDKHIADNDHDIAASAFRWIDEKYRTATKRESFAEIAERNGMAKVPDDWKRTRGILSGHLIPTDSDDIEGQKP